MFLREAWAKSGMKACCLSWGRAGLMLCGSWRRVVNVNVVGDDVLFVYLMQVTLAVPARFLSVYRES